MSKQIQNGKAFEFALANALSSKLRAASLNVIVHDAESCWVKAKGEFSKLTATEQARFAKSANLAIDLIYKMEPRLTYGFSNNEPIDVKLQPDQKGEIGDVRDILSIRSLLGWEIGISAKNNNKAVKHSRLSGSAHFADRWFGKTNSDVYITNTDAIFAQLKTLSETKILLNKLPDKNKRFYMPVLKEFKDELLLLEQGDPSIATELFRYCVGKQDFYKVIQYKGRVELHSFNFNGKLGLPMNSDEPLYKPYTLRLPNKFISITMKPGNETTLIVTMDEGWELAFRIHNGDEAVKPNLKFDIQITAHPPNLISSIPTS